MKLQDTDWNHPAGATLVDVEYPDALIQPFINWLWTTKQWHENPEAVFRRFQQFRDRMVEWKQKNPAAAVPVQTDATGPIALLRLLADPDVRAQVEAELKRLRNEQAAANRKAALEKARTARAAKRSTVAG